MKIIFLLGTILLSNWASANCSQSDAFINTSSEGINLFLWNVKEDRALDIFPAEIQESKSSLFFFQEASQSGLDILSNYLNKKTYTAIHNNRKYGVASLSTYEPCESYTIDVQDEPFFAKIDKGLVVQKFKFKSKILKVINVHLPLFVSSSNLIANAYEMALLKLLAEVRKHEGPIIIAGDFNGWTPNRFRNLLPSFARLGKLSEVSFIVNTGNRAAFLKLDRVFYKNLNLEDESTDTDNLDSDHFIRKVIFKL